MPPSVACTQTPTSAHPTPRPWHAPWALEEGRRLGRPQRHMGTEGAVGLRARSGGMATIVPVLSSLPYPPENLNPHWPEHHSLHSVAPRPHPTQLSHLGRVSMEGSWLWGAAVFPGQLLGVCEPQAGSG